MKKRILYSAVAAILSFQAIADDPQATASNPAETAAPQAAPTETPPTTTTNQTPPTPSQATVAPTINCDTKIPADQTTIDESLIKTWAQKATEQSFDFKAQSLDADLEKLKACYTEQGWQGFYSALKQSGNIDSIQSKHLTVSSQIEGPVNLETVKDNQWKATMPLQVVYQNDKQKLTQLLTVDVLIGRKKTGDLGIIQMIASPRLPKNQSAQPTPASDNPAPETPASAAPQQ